MRGRTGERQFKVLRLLAGVEERLLTREIAEKVPGFHHESARATLQALTTRGFVDRSVIGLGYDWAITEAGRETYIFKLSNPL